MPISSLHIQTNLDKYVLYENGTETIIVSTSFIGNDDNEEVFSVKLVSEDKSSGMEKMVKITPEILLSQNFICVFNITLANEDRLPVTSSDNQKLITKKYNVIVHFGNHHYGSGVSDSVVEWSMENTIDLALSENYIVK
jgi:hypothetical protein